MRLWFWRKVEQPCPDATEAVARAEEGLEDAKRTRRQAAAVSRRLKLQDESNGFAELVEGLLRNDK